MNEENYDRIGAGWITKGAKQKYVKLKVGGLYHFVFANRDGLAICIAPSPGEKLKQIGWGKPLDEGGARVKFDNDNLEYLLLPNERKEGKEEIETLPDYILWAKKNEESQTTKESETEEQEYMPQDFSEEEY